jgi:hypothetical protein
MIKQFYYILISLTLELGLIYNFFLGIFWIFNNFTYFNDVKKIWDRHPIYSINFFPSTLNDKNYLILQNISYINNEYLLNPFNISSILSTRFYLNYSNLNYLDYIENSNNFGITCKEGYKQCGKLDEINILCEAIENECPINDIFINNLSYINDEYVSIKFNDKLDKNDLYLHYTNKKINNKVITNIFLNNISNISYIKNFKKNNNNEINYNKIFIDEYDDYNIKLIFEEKMIFENYLSYKFNKKNIYKENNVIDNDTELSQYLYLNFNIGYPEKIFKNNLYKKINLKKLKYIFLYFFIISLLYGICFILNQYKQSNEFLDKKYNHCFIIMFFLLIYINEKEFYLINYLIHFKYNFEDKFLDREIFLIEFVIFFLKFCRYSILISILILFYIIINENYNKYLLYKKNKRNKNFKKNNYNIVTISYSL